MPFAMPSRRRTQIMRKCFLVMPVLLLAAGCSRNPTSAAASTAGGGPVPNDASAPAPITAAAKPSPNGTTGPATEPVAPPAPAKPAPVIPNGTALHVRLDSEVDTKHNRAGDAFTATLTEPIQVGGETVLPRG